MNIAIISDCHISPKSSPQEFHHTEESFVKFLNFLDSNFDKIILNGDIFECLTGILPFREEHQLKLCLNDFKLIASFLKNPKVQYIAGNHDQVAIKLLGAKTEYLLNSYQPILFLHGHDKTKLNSYKMRKANIKTYIRSLGKRLNVSLCKQNSITFEDELRYNEFIFKEAKKNVVSIVVSSHTHKRKIIESSDKTITMINSGNCLSELQYATITFEGLFSTPKFELHIF